MEARILADVISDEVVEPTVISCWIDHNHGFVAAAGVAAQMSHSRSSARFSSIAKIINFNGNIAITTRDGRKRETPTWVGYATVGTRVNVKHGIASGVDVLTRISWPSLLHSAAMRPLLLTGSPPHRAGYESEYRTTLRPVEGGCSREGRVSKIQQLRCNCVAHAYAPLKFTMNRVKGHAPVLLLTIYFYR